MFYSLSIAMTRCNTWSDDMTKAETREMKSVCLYISAGMTDTAARALSALIRAARTAKSRAALMEQAKALKLTQEPDFII
jgi:hypothetical protein